MESQSEGEISRSNSKSEYGVRFNSSVDFQTRSRSNSGAQLTESKDFTMRLGMASTYMESSQIEIPKPRRVLFLIQETFKERNIRRAKRADAIQPLVELDMIESFDTFFFIAKLTMRINILEFVSDLRENRMMLTQRQTIFERLTDFYGGRALKLETSARIVCAVIKMGAKLSKMDRELDQLRTDLKSLCRLQENKDMIAKEQRRMSEPNAKKEPFMRPQYGKLFNSTDWEHLEQYLINNHDDEEIVNDSGLCTERNMKCFKLLKRAAERSFYPSDWNSLEQRLIRTGRDIAPVGRVEDRKESYQIVKLTERVALHAEIMKILQTKDEEEEIQIKRQSIFTSAGGFSPAALMEKNSVDEYWTRKVKRGGIVEEKSLGQVHKETLMGYDVMVIVAAFRMWTKLAKLRKMKNVASGTVDKLILVQTAIRRWLARDRIYDLDQEREHVDTNFWQFCASMCDTGDKKEKGMKVQMFSKKYGIQQARTLKIKVEDDGAYLTYDRGQQLWSTDAKHNLNEIYEVCKGLSNFPYPSTEGAQIGACIHLKLLGDSVIDFECKDTAQARVLFEGFSRIRTLMYTQAPFYIDKEGFPRRAGPSVIEYALKNAENLAKKESEEQQAFQHMEMDDPQDNRSNMKHRNSLENETKSDRYARELTAVSEADHQRFRTALDMLRQEYDMWDTAYTMEVEDFNRHVEQRRRKLEKNKLLADADRERQLAAIAASSDDEYKEDEHKEIVAELEGSIADLDELYHDEEDEDHLFDDEAIKC